MAELNQIWSIATGDMFKEDSKPSKDDPTGTLYDITNVQFLNDLQAVQVREAFGLWDDVSGFTATQEPDNVNQAREAAAGKVKFSGNWTRVAFGTIPNPDTLGINKPGGKDGHYREIYIDPAKVEGDDTFEYGSQAFYVLLHEIGHSVLDFPLSDDDHIFGDAIMARVAPNLSGWFPSTPMSSDIDAAISHYGAATTRTGDDTYGFNAHFSGAWRVALDFDANTEPLVTIYDSGGNDTLDASGFGSRVHIDLRPGMSSWLRLGGYVFAERDQPFAVIYKGATAETTTWIENAVGGGSNDEIFGNALRNHLYGGGGDDILNGREDADTMEGGAGDDTYTVDDSGDQVFDVAGDQGGLHDKIYTTLDWYDMGAWDKGVWVEELHSIGSGAFIGHGNDLKNKIVGGADWDTLYGWDDNDTLLGGEGFDTLYGEEGNDTLDGEGGLDVLIGGTGDDHYFVLDGGDQVREVSGDEGGLHDTIHTMAEPYTLQEGVEDLVFEDDYKDLMPAMLGSEPTRHLGYGNGANNIITSSRGRDILYGFGGNDTLDGGAAADSMYGGADNDTYIVDDVGDVVSEMEIAPDLSHRDAGGTDEVRTNRGIYWLEDDPHSVIENLTYTGTERFWGSGNKVNNTISGGDSSVGDWLFGYGGKDTLFGFDGEDYLVGGEGADHMEGGSGKDVFAVDNGDDSGGDLVIGGESYDTVEADGSVATVGLNLRLLAPEFYAENPKGFLSPNTSVAISVEEVIGGSGKDKIDASRLLADENVWVYGLSGDDTVISGGHGIAFDGGADFDTIEIAGASSDYDITLIPDVYFGPNWFAIAEHGTDITNPGTKHVDVVHDVEVVQFTDGEKYNLTNTNWIPLVAVAAQTLPHHHKHHVSDWIKASDRNSDTITQYRFMDNGAASSSGYFSSDTNGQYAANTVITVNAADLGNLYFNGGSVAGTETVSVQVFDGKDWSDWKTFDVTTVPPIMGTDGADVLTGDANDNILMALGGDDELIGLQGSDVLDGGTGTDTANYSASLAGVTVNLADGTGHGGDAEGDTFIGIEHAIGSAFDDIFQGGTERGQFLAGDGNDTIIGGTVFDLLDGGAGDDTLIGTGGQTTMFGGDGNDTMTGSLTSNNAMYGGLGNDTFTGGDLTDWMTDVEGGDDVMHGGGGYDVIVDYYGVNELYGEGGTDWLISGSNQGSLLDGGDDNDTLFASFGGNTLIGGAGEDVLDNQEGSAIANIFTGGADADTFVYRAGVSVEANVIVTDFQDGVDHIGLPFQPFDQLTITDTPEGAVIKYYDTSPMLLVGISASQISREDFLLGIGAEGDDTLVGTEGDDTLVGTAADNTIDALGGNDTIDGGLGADTLTAGAGQDTLIVDNADTVDGGAGADAVFADASTAAAGFRFNVAGTGVENVFASTGNDVVDASGLSASSPLTRISGNAGDDTLIGGDGMDWIWGGQGTDTAVFAGNLGDYTVAQQSTDGAMEWTGWTTVTHNATGVEDWVLSVEKLQFTDATIVAAPLPLQAATAGADVIAASDAGEVVDGLAGDDQLSGGTGSDTLVGGDGADALIGGAGTDLLYVDSADSLVDGGEGYDYVYADDSTGHTGLHFMVANTNVEFVYGNVGNDVIDASGLATGINIVGVWGNDVLTGGAVHDAILGGEGNDTVLGNGGDDTLCGEGGDDVLTGGAGADTFYFGSDALSGIAEAWGKDTITDFTAADGDRIDLTYAGATSLADLSLADNAEGNAVIGFGESTITLLGVSAASLDQSHFLLAV